MVQPSGVSRPVLITFPPSLDSELGRFLVDHYGIEHEEQRHTLIFSFFATLSHGFTFIFPLLYSDAFKLEGPRPMADHFDTKCAAELRLLPQDDGQKRQLESDWTLFNDTLAFATAKFAYYHLLPHREIMIEPLSAGTPSYEQTAVKSAYWLFSGLLKLLLRLSAQTAQDSLDQVRKIFDAVDARLAAGQKYLGGDRLTLSDLAFAVAAAPVVLPPAYGGPMPSYDQMPAPVQAAVTEMRARPAGAFALRIYQEERNRVGGKLA